MESVGFEAAVRENSPGMSWRDMLPVLGRGFNRFALEEVRAVPEGVLVLRVVLVLAGNVAVGSALPATVADPALPAAMAGLAQLVVMRPSQQPVYWQLGVHFFLEERGEHHSQRESRQQAQQAAARAGARQ